MYLNKSEIDQNTQLCFSNVAGKDTIPIYEVKHPHLHARSLFTTARCCNTEDTQEAEVEEDYHSIIKDTERSKGKIIEGCSEYCKGSHVGKTKHSLYRPLVNPAFIKFRIKHSLS